MTKRIRGNRWCFTLNNYSAEEITWIDSAECKYIIYGKEVGKSGTPHLQGYLELEKPKELSSVKKMIGNRAHLELARGTSKQASDYCRKEGVVTERGEMSAGQGHRTDLDELGQRILDGETPEDIAKTNPGAYVRYANGLQKLSLTLEPPTRDVRVVAYWGEAGSGKTESAMKSGDFYMLSQNTNGTLWFDGYRGQKTLILDDFYGWLKYGDLLKILEGHPYRCQMKGSSTWAHWTTVIITSNKPPEEWYKTGLTPALRRRIAYIQHFEKKCMEIVQWKTNKIGGIGREVGGNTIPPLPEAASKIIKIMERLAKYERSYYGQCSSQ